MSSLIADIRAAIATDPIFTEAQRDGIAVPKSGGGWYATYEAISEDREIGVNVRLWACNTLIPNVEEVALGIPLRFRKVLRENLSCALVGVVERAQDDNPAKIKGKRAPQHIDMFATFDVSVVGTPSGQGVG